MLTELSRQQAIQRRKEAESPMEPEKKPVKKKEKIFAEEAEAVTDENN